MNIVTRNDPKSNIREVNMGKNVKTYDFINLYECEIDDDTQVGTFVEIQRGVKIGKRCRIQSHTFICEGVTIEDDVFIGHGVMFINDKNPSAASAQNKSWSMSPVIVKEGASIGTGAIIMGGVSIGKNAVVGAGAVVTRSVPDNETFIGVPARKHVTSL